MEEPRVFFPHFSFEVNSVVNAKCHAIYYKMTQQNTQIKTELMLTECICIKYSLKSAEKEKKKKKKNSQNSSFIGSDRLLINIGWL